jgi:hypothetical protein
MMKFIRIPIFVLCAYVLSTTASSCNKSDGITPTDSIPPIDSLPVVVDSMPVDGSIRLGAIYIDGKISQRIEYDTDKRVRRIYEYSLSDTAKVNPEYRVDYHYNTEGQVDKEIVYNMRSGSLQRETMITYVVDSIFYHGYNGTSKLAIIRPNKTTRTGDFDSVYYDNKSLSLNYSLYTMEGNDLTKFFNFNYLKTPYMEQDYRYEERYSYDTTLNPLWPLIENNLFMARVFLDIVYKERRPFAFTLSKHNPLQVEKDGGIIYWLDYGVTFEYKLLPGSSYPIEQKWIDRGNGSVYMTYKYEYIQVE